MTSGDESADNDDNDDNDDDHSADNDDSGQHKRSDRRRPTSKDRGSKGHGANKDLPDGTAKFVEQLARIAGPSDSPRRLEGLASPGGRFFVEVDHDRGRGELVSLIVRLTAEFPSEQMVRAVEVLRSELAGPARVACHDGELRAQLDVPVGRDHATHATLITYLLEAADRLLSLQGLAAEFTVDELERVRATVMPPPGPPRIGLDGRCIGDGLPYSSDGDLLVGFAQWSSGSAVCAGVAGVPTAWLRIVERDGQRYVRCHNSVGYWSDVDPADRRELVESVVGGTVSTTIVTVDQVPVVDDDEAESSRELVTVHVEWPEQLVDGAVLEHMVWAVATLTDWWVDQLEGDGQIDTPSGVLSPGLRMVTGDPWTSAAERGIGLLNVVSTDQYPRPYRPLSREQWIFESEPGQLLGVSDMEPPDLFGAESEDDSCAGFPGDWLDDSDADRHDSESVLDHLDWEVTDPDLESFLALGNSSPESWHRRNAEIPISGVDPAELIAPAVPAVAPTTTLWAQVALRLRATMVGTRGADRDSAATAPADARAVAALDLLIAGPAAMDGLAEFAVSGDAPDPSAVDRFVEEQVDRNGRQRVNRWQRNSDAVAAFGRNLLDRDTGRVAAVALAQILVTVRAERSGFAASVAAHRTLVGTAEHDRSLAKTASQATELLARAATMAAGVVDADVAHALMDLAVTALEQGLVLADIPHSADGVTRGLGALFGVAVGLDQALAHDTPADALVYLSGTVRAVDLLRLVIGDGIGPIARVHGAPLVANRREGPTVVLGPPGSGKTSTINLAVASHNGPVVATTSKVADWSGSFVGPRSTRGTVFVFDPGFTAHHLPRSAVRIRFDLVSLCPDYEAALRVANALTAVAGRGNLQDGDFWRTLAETLLAPMLLAANVSGGSVSSVVDWVDRGDCAEALRILGEHGERRAQRGLQGHHGRESRTRDSVMVTATQVIAPFRGESAHRLATTGESFDPVEDLITGQGTLLLCLDLATTAHLAGLVALFLDHVVRARMKMTDEGYTGPALLIAGDEIANIAPLPALPRLVSEGPGRGIQALLCLQDSVQMQARWGSEGELLMTASGHRLLFPGVTRAESLAWVQALNTYDRSSGPIVGFGSRADAAASTPSVDRPEALADIARPGDGMATVVTPSADVMSVCQARAQDDPLFRQASVESEGLQLAWRMTPA